MKSNILVYLSLGVFLSIFAFCGSSDKKPEPNVAETADSSSCENPETIKDPNNTKPMALMMRQMATYADSMRAQLLRDEALDSNSYPFIRFYLVEPTNPNVLEPNFFDNAKRFQEAFHDLFRKKGNQKEMYNLMIQECINCHENYCTGPLRKIRKLPLKMD